MAARPVAHICVWGHLCPSLFVAWGLCPASITGAQIFRTIILFPFRGGIKRERSLHRQGELIQVAASWSWRAPSHQAVGRKNKPYLKHSPTNRSVTGENSALFMLRDYFYIYWRWRNHLLFLLYIYTLQNSHKNTLIFAEQENVMKIEFYQLKGSPDLDIG